MNIIIRFVFVFFMSVVLVACGQQGDDASKEAHSTDSAKSSAQQSTVSGDMVLGATTSSVAARKNYMAGWQAFEMFRFNKANDLFKLATAADKNFASAHLMKALSATSTEKFAIYLADAQKHAAGASKGEQLLISAMAKGFANDQAGQVATIKELTALHPDSPRAWFFLAQAYGNQNDTAHAVSALNKALEINPQFAMAHMQLGTNYVFLEPKDFDKAEEHIRKAIAIVPNEPFPYDLLGDVHRAKGDLSAAYADYTRATELDPVSGSAFQQRAHVNSFIGNYEEARADYSHAAKLETKRGTNNGPLFLVYKAFVNLYEGKHDAAIEELKGLAVDADSMVMQGIVDLKINALTNAAQIAIYDGNEKSARALIEAVAILMREQADEVGTEQFRYAQEANITYMEGMLAARLGKTKDADTKAAEFAKHVATNTSPRKLERMHEIQGMANFYKKNYAAAANYLAMGDVVNNMYTKYHLAVASVNTGDVDKAKKLFDELAKWNFNDVSYAMLRSDILKRAAQS